MANPTAPDSTAVKPLSRDEFHDYDAVPTESGHEVLRKLRKQRDPDHVYVACSGGEDSMAALHFAHQSPEIEISGVCHIDTGFGIPQSTEYVQQMCDQWGIECILIGNQNCRFSHERYEQLVLLYGFPGATPTAHGGVRRNLKDKPFNRFERNLDGDVALISGVRRHESERRYRKLNREGIQRVNGILWASPLVNFTDSDVAAYHSHHKIPANPVAELLCSSGECMCGSFGDRENLPLIEEYFPNFAQRIYDLEWEVLERCARGEIKKEYALWANGSLDSGEYTVRTDANQTSLMCSDCEDMCPGQPYELTRNPLSPAEEWLQKHSLSEYFEWPFFCAPCNRVVDDPYTHRHDVHPFDEDRGLAGEWDLRMVDVWTSDRIDLIITEPNGWHLDPGYITTDPAEAENRKHKYYFEDVALSHCDDHAHKWEAYNGGPVRQCQECFAFDLTDYDPENPGPPAVDLVDTDNRPAQTQEEANRLNQQLSAFR